jgi:hypothetical protein
MNFSQDCLSCNRRVSLKYDELDGTPLFCPFCGEELGDDNHSTYEDMPGISGADDEDNWEDDDR